MPRLIFNEPKKPEPKKPKPEPEEDPEEKELREADSDFIDEGLEDL